MSKEINAGDLKLKDVFGGNKQFNVEYYQRDYKWTDHAKVLFYDLLAAFKEGPDAHYFLGAYVTDERTENGIRTEYVIDGQQRITTLTLLFIAISNALRQRGEEELAANVISSVVKINEYFILAIPQHQHILKSLVESDDASSQSKFEGILLFDNYRALSTALVDLAGEEWNFFQWLLVRVQFAQIEAIDPNSSYTIFETMNDRGLDLSASEIWKGYVLSNITDEKSRLLAKEQWDDTSKRVEAADRKYRSFLKRPQLRDGIVPMDKFLEIFLKAKYAVTGWSKGDEHSEVSEGGTIIESDWESLKPGNIHRWTRQNARDRLSLSDPDSYSHLMNLVRKYAGYYCELLLVAQGIGDSLLVDLLVEEKGKPSILPDETRVVLLAAVSEDHIDEERLKAWRTVATFLDIFWAVRTWGNNRGGLNKNSALSIALLLRNEQLLNTPNKRVWYLVKELEKTHWSSNEPIDPAAKLKVEWTKFLLKLSFFLDKEAGRTNRFVDYLHLDGVAKLEIEHILPTEPYDNHPFGSGSEYAEQRARPGASLLLPKSINASIKDKKPRDKIPHYDGFYLTTLIKSDLYLDEKALPLKSSIGAQHLSKFISDNSLSLGPGNHIDRSYLDSRVNLYRELSTILWSVDRLKLYSSISWDELTAEALKWSPLESNGELVFSYSWSDLWRDNKLVPGKILNFVSCEGEELKEIFVLQDKSLRYDGITLAHNELEKHIPFSSIRSVSEGGVSSGIDEVFIYSKNIVEELMTLKQKLFFELKEKHGLNPSVIGERLPLLSEVKASEGFNSKVSGKFFEKLDENLYISKKISEEKLSYILSFYESAN